MRTELAQVRPVLRPLALVAVMGVLALLVWVWLLWTSPVSLAFWLVVGLGLAVLWIAPLAVLAVATLVLALSGHAPRRLLGPARTALKLLLPVALGLARVTGSSRDQVRAGFVHGHNLLVTSQLPTAGAGRGSGSLLLLPHCMQRADCPHRLTWQVGNCRRCGGCPVGDALDLAERAGFQVAVASGGTQARMLLKRVRPRLVLAVACERELAEGISDVGDVSVVALINQQPLGACRDTAVDLGQLGAALERLAGREGAV